jgi:LacI family gluconate utilization system Gnt-I transcriptional repressor
MRTLRGAPTCVSFIKIFTGESKIKHKRTTLDDVARAAGVSAITVSRALRNPETVSVKLRNSIDSAISTLGYVPNLAASRLASARSHSIGVMVPTLYNVIFADYLQAIHEVLLPAKFQPLVVNSRYSAEAEEVAIRTLLGQRVEAIIIVGTDHTPTARRLLADARIPIVESFSRSADPIGMNVGSNLDKAGIDATRYLIGLGHKEIGFLVGNIDERASLRLKGYRCAMESAGLDPNRHVATLPQLNSVALGAALVAEVKKRGQMPGALFCIDDNVALGALHALRGFGLSVPGHVSVLGFHDLDFAICTEPALSTVATNRYKMGALAAQMTLKALNSPTSSRRRWHDVGYRLVPRASTSQAQASM